MTVEDLVSEITALPVEDRARLHRQLALIELIENPYSARFEIENEAYGKIEGTLYFEPSLREVCKRLQQNAFPQDESGKNVNDGHLLRPPCPEFCY